MSGSQLVGCNTPEAGTRSSDAGGLLLLPLRLLCTAARPRGQVAAASRYCRCCRCCRNAARQHVLLQPGFGAAAATGPSSKYRCTQPQFPRGRVIRPSNNKTDCVRQSSFANKRTNSAGVGVAVVGAASPAAIRCIRRFAPIHVPLDPGDNNALRPAVAAAPPE